MLPILIAHYAHYGDMDVTFHAIDGTSSKPVNVFVPKEPEQLMGWVEGEKPEVWLSQHCMLHSNFEALMETVIGQGFRTYLILPNNRAKNNFCLVPVNPAEVLNAHEHTLGA